MAWLISGLTVFNLTIDIVHVNDSGEVMLQYSMHKVNILLCLSD